MIQWLTDRFASNRLDLVVTALVSCSLTAVTLFTVQHAIRTTRLESLKHSIPTLKDAHDVAGINDFGGASTPVSHDTKQSRQDAHGAALAIRAQAGEYDDDLILEQLARNRIFLTDAGLASLRGAFVIVVGCGGVGSHAAAALTRSGVGKLRLIDFDQVTLSSLNRHAVATLADVGTPKVVCLRKRLEQITPWTLFDCRNQLFSASVADDQLQAWTDSPSPSQLPTFVIDAIDNIDSKVDLLHYCHSHNIPVISSMGAGCKSDPTRIRIDDISASNEDALSRSTRRRLRLRGVSTGIPCVFSTERAAPGKAELQPLPDEEYAKGRVNELGILPDFRVRILPVLGSMPAIFGLTIANHVILSIARYPTEYIPLKARDKLYEAILSHLVGIEGRLAKKAGHVDASQGLKIPITQDDVGFLVEEVFRGKSVISGLSTRLALIRWQKPDMNTSLVDKSIPGQIYAKLKQSDLVLMTKEEAAQHEKKVLLGDDKVEEIYAKSVLETVEMRRRQEAQYRSET